jgi:murein DD-endopeptidase MepM/ murein hydrolase activator NlpD
MLPKKRFLLAALVLLLAAPVPCAEPLGLPHAIRALVEQGEYAKAAGQLKKLARETNNPDAVYAYLYCVYQMGSPKDVLRMAQAQTYPDAFGDRRGQILLGLSHWRVGDSRKAVESIAGVLIEDPSDELALDCLRCILLTADRLVRTDLATQLLSHVRTSPFLTAFIQGTLYQSRGQYKEARKRLDDAFRLSPESVAVGKALRDYFRQTGEVDSCRRMDAWLAARGIGGPRDSDSSSVALETLELDFGSTSSAGLCRLPWPGGVAVYCGTHEGRAATPHSGRGRHALDFLLPNGVPVMAVRDGLVWDLCDNNRARGGTDFQTFVLISHGDGTYARYYHLKSGTIRVKKGQPVRQGTVLAESGRSGRCQSRHLHFEMLRGAGWRRSEMPIYRTYETIPAEFAETSRLNPEGIPDRWLVSRNRPLPNRQK